MTVFQISFLLYTMRYTPYGYKMFPDVLRLQLTQMPTLIARSVPGRLSGDVGRGFWNSRVAALGSRTVRPFALRDFGSLQARVCQIRLHRPKPHKAGANRATFKLLNLNHI